MLLPWWREKRKGCGAPFSSINRMIQPLLYYSPPRGFSLLLSFSLKRKKGPPVPSFLRSLVFPSIFRHDFPTIRAGILKPDREQFTGKKADWTRYAQSVHREKVDISPYFGLFHRFHNPTTTTTYLYFGYKEDLPCVFPVPPPTWQRHLAP